MNKEITCCLLGTDTYNDLSDSILNISFVMFDLIFNHGVRRFLVHSGRGLQALGFVLGEKFKDIIADVKVEFVMKKSIADKLKSLFYKCIYDDILVVDEDESEEVVMKKNSKYFIAYNGIEVIVGINSL